MPLSKARDKARKRLERAQRTVRIVQPVSNLSDVQPTKAELQAMIHKIERGDKVRVGKDIYSCTETGTEIPWYNPELHTTGDKVKQMRNGHVEVVTL